MMLETPCHRDVAICRYVLKNPNPRPKACAIFALSIQRIYMTYKVISFSCCKKSYVQNWRRKKNLGIITLWDFIHQIYCSCKQRLRDPSIMS